MTVNNEETRISALLGLSSEDRYEHFLQAISEHKAVWSVKNDQGFLIPKTPEGMEYFSLWPSPEIAQRVADAHFPGHEILEISAEELLAHWLPLFTNEHIKVAIFPDMNWTFWCIEPADLKQDLLGDAEGE